MNQKTDKKKYIIIEGAQSTGKTTLINQMKDIYPQAYIVCQVARKVIIQQKITHEQLQKNINNFFQDLQYKILLAQFQAQIESNNINKNLYILDRSVISPLVYSLFYFSQNKDLFNKIEDSYQFQQRVKQYKKSAIVFLIHPQESILKYDGVRKESTFKELQQITKIYKQILQKYQIKYIQIKQLQNRLTLVSEIIQGKK